MTTFPASSADQELIQRVADGLGAVRARVAASGREGLVRIVAVTKTFGSSAVRAAAAAGLTAVGENYIDELEAKRAAAGDVPVAWHYLGALQTNKIARVCAAADLVCSLSRSREIDRIARLRPGMAVYVQVDHTGAEGRNGAPPGEVADLVTRARAAGLEVRGLMTVAPPDAAGTRRAFLATSALADDLGLVERSMGMSGDLDIALECGTTELRLGQVLFGPRGAA